MAEPARVDPLWDMIEGRASVPPAARLLGWRLQAIDPDTGPERPSLRTLSDAEGRVVATASATARVIPLTPRA